MFVDKKREIYLAVSLPAASVSLHVKKAPTSCGPTLCLKTFNYSSERLFSSHNFKKKKKNSSNWKQPPEPSLLIFHTKQSMKSLKKKKNNKKTLPVSSLGTHKHNLRINLMTIEIKVREKYMERGIVAKLMSRPAHKIYIFFNIFPQMDFDCVVLE